MNLKSSESEIALNSSPGRIDVLVASKSYLFRMGMLHLLEKHPRISCMGATDADEVLAGTWMRGRPPVTIVDESTIDLVTLVAIVRHIDLSARVIVVAGDENAEALTRALRLKVAGYLSRTAEARDILRCLDEVADGRRFVSAAFQRHERELTLVKVLSPRQIEILSLMASGCTNRTIASLLSIGPETVKTHVRYICQKLGVNKRISAILAAQNLGILELRRRGI